MIPIGIAAGHVKQPHHLAPLARRLDPTVLHSVTFGSYTLEERQGNSGRTFSPPLNALGLPNLGIKAAIPHIIEMCRMARAAGMEPRISIAGFTVTEFVKIAKAVREVEPDAVLEFNFGCPNVRAQGAQKPIIAFDLGFMGELLYACRSAIGFPIGLLDVKVSPYSDPLMLARVSSLLGNFADLIGNVVACNTYPNAFGYDEEEQPLVSANDGLAGLSGPSMTPIVLGQIRQLRKLLPPSMGIIGVGGVNCGAVVRHMELAGARGVQIGLAYFESEDPRVIQNVAADYAMRYG